MKNILESCSLSTEKIDEIKITKSSSNSNRRQPSAEEFHAKDASIFEEYEVYYRSAQKAKQEKTLKYVDMRKPFNKNNAIHIFSTAVNGYRPI